MHRLSETLAVAVPQLCHLQRPEAPAECKRFCYATSIIQSYPSFYYESQMPCRLWPSAAIIVNNDYVMPRVD
jgi:hypothetical protein